MGKQILDALPPGLQDDQLDPAEQSMMTECRRLSAQLGYSLVHRADWWHLTAPGIRVRCADLADCRQWLRNRARNAHNPLSADLPTVDLGLPENALQAVFLACPIDIANWTDDQPDATGTRDTDQPGASNEK